MFSLLAATSAGKGKSKQPTPALQKPTAQNLPQTAPQRNCPVYRLASRNPSDTAERPAHRFRDCRSVQSIVAGTGTNKRQAGVFGRLPACGKTRLERHPSRGDAAYLMIDFPGPPVGQLVCQAIRRTHVHLSRLEKVPKQEWCEHQLRVFLGRSIKLNLLALVLRCLDHTSV